MIWLNYQARTIFFWPSKIYHSYFTDSSPSEIISSLDSSFPFNDYVVLYCIHFLCFSDALSTHLTMQFMTSTITIFCHSMISLKRSAHSIYYLPTIVSLSCFISSKSLIFLPHSIISIFQMPSTTHSLSHFAFIFDSPYITTLSLWYSV